MSLEIKIITTPFILGISVNCYLVKTDSGFVLIDTANASGRRAIESELEHCGCTPDNLKLIILTHGDFDHCGNAAYLREKFNAVVAMHEADNGMVEHGDMLWNRQQPNFIVKAVMRVLFRLDKSDQFIPNFYIGEGDNLSEYGFNAEVIELPGHSRGSVGLLTAQGDLFCGDLLANTNRPDVWTIIDDAVSTKMSVEKLMDKPIDRVYPGHGRPFPLQPFWESIHTSDTLSKRLGR